MVALGIIRTHANRLLEQFSVTAPPVPIQTIVEGCLLKVVEVDRIDLEDGALISETQTIEVRRNKPLVAKRFTLAHELGHWILFHKNLAVEETDELGGIYDNRTDEEVTDSFEQPADKETEANQFAAEILMPFNWIKSDWKSDHDPVALARKYLVSEQAMWIRLLGLHLIK